MAVVQVVVGNFKGIVYSLFRRRTAKKYSFNIKKSHITEIYLVVIDKVKFNRIITNILDNSIKFAVKVAVELDYKISNNNLNISIRDTGFGI